MCFVLPLGAHSIVMLAFYVFIPAFTRQYMPHLFSLTQVRLSIDRFTGQRYACKIVDKKKFLKHAESSKRPLKSDALLQEVSIMQQLSHPNIVRIFECFETSSSLYIILELLQVRRKSTAILTLFC